MGGPLGRPIIQGFIKSMDYIRARKGVAMTASTFTEDEIDFVDRIEGKRFVLFDGGWSVDLMIEYNLGVTTTQTDELKEVANDFFDTIEG